MAINFFSTAQKEQIVQAIREAETNTSGEIKVHVETRCPGEVMDHAKEIFLSLKLNQTKLRNGVLFYLAVDDHKFAILGDSGIDTVVPANFWQEIKDRMRAQFKTGAVTQGLCEGILLAGQQLKAHFPYQSDDTNELSDDISFGKSS
ncbi:TPM domain-containing protein [Rhodocytophaga rosea]|uniref:TPM domain-containing protein n=1 Tax=Rhodocytophaga rosea TaxID=2704465 RepID=A0A6C0GGS1_9BACT|nr:TPM domain-containing protein [Rhodocytophaga rosea]QHT67206.1 TPM domain-containing protein [Rhodocytophaga rosea]